MLSWVEGSGKGFLKKAMSCAYPGEEKFRRGDCQCKDRSVFGMFEKWFRRQVYVKYSKQGREGWKLGEEVASGQIVLGVSGEGAILLLGERTCAWGIACAVCGG